MGSNVAVGVMETAYDCYEVRSGASLEYMQDSTSWHGMCVNGCLAACACVSSCRVRMDSAIAGSPKARCSHIEISNTGLRYCASVQQHQNHERRVGAPAGNEAISHR